MCSSEGNSSPRVLLQKIQRFNWQSGP